MRAVISRGNVLSARKLFTIASQGQLETSSGGKGEPNALAELAEGKRLGSYLWQSSDFLAIDRDTLSRAGQTETIIRLRKQEGSGISGNERGARCINERSPGWEHHTRSRLLSARCRTPRRDAEPMNDILLLALVYMHVDVTAFSIRADASATTRTNESRKRHRSLISAALTRPSLLLAENFPAARNNVRSARRDYWSSNR